MKVKLRTLKIKDCNIIFFLITKYTALSLPLFIEGSEKRERTVHVNTFKHLCQGTGFKVINSKVLISKKDHLFKI